jgi:hypothetical protein
MTSVVTIPERASVYEIDIDIHNKTLLYPVYSKQYEDGSRFIKAKLWDDGILYPVLSTDTIYFAGTKNGNKGVLSTTVDTNDYLFGIDSEGNIIYQIRSTDTDTDTSYEAEFRVLDSNNRLKATPKIKMFIEKSALQDSTPVTVGEGSIVVDLINTTNDAKIVVEEFYKVAADKFGINDAIISTITAWSSNKINNLYTNLYNRMGLMPMDGGTFFEEYIDWTADAGTF